MTQKKSRGGYLEALLQSCPSAIIAINKEGSMTFVNEAACALVEKEMNDLIGENITSVYETSEQARETNRKLHMSGGVIHDHESNVITKSDKIVPVRISAAHLKDSEGKYIGAVGYFEKYRPWTAAETGTKAYAEQLEAKLLEWQDLGAPVFEVYPGLTMVAVVGRVDELRFTRIKTVLCDHVKSEKSSVVIINMSAALVSSDKVAKQLVKTIRTISILGATCILAGVQTSLAEGMEPVCDDVRSLKSYSSVATALEVALEMLGRKIAKD